MAALPVAEYVRTRAHTLHERVGGNMSRDVAQAEELGKLARDLANDLGSIAERVLGSVEDYNAAAHLDRRECYGTLQADLYELAELLDVTPQSDT